MTDNTYIVEQSIAPTESTTYITDPDGTDWIVMQSVHAVQSEITLQYFFSNGLPAQASGAYSDGSGTKRLVVEGIVENARGANGADVIVGSILNNVIVGDATATGPGGADTISAAAGNDTVYGGAGGDGIDCGEGSDIAYGNAGNDTISGGAGIDIIEGGEGADTLSGGSGLGDTLSYRSSAAGVTVLITFGLTTTGAGGDAQGDRIAGFTDVWGSKARDIIRDTVEGTVSFGGNQNRFWGFDGSDDLRLGGANDKGWGGTGADLMLGGAGADQLWGEDGNDQVFGGDADDVVSGGSGNDLLSGDDGDDVVSGGADRDRLYGGEGRDRMTCGEGDDLAFGNEGDDRILGNAGNDTLIGSEGVDTLVGGGGADEFRFLRAIEGGDRILDMARADTVALQGFGRDLRWDNVGALDEDGMRLVDSGRNLIFRANLDGDMAIEFQITFVGVDALARSQFEF